MKLKTTYAGRDAEHVKPELAALLRQFQDEPTNSHPLWPLFCAVVDTMDEATVSPDTCIILGTTRSRTSYSVTFKLRGQTASCYGTDAAEILASVEEAYTAG